MTRSNVLSLAVVGILAGIGRLVLPMSDAGEDRGAYASVVLTLIIAWGFVGTGVYVALRRLKNRIGMLLIAVGLAWLVASMVGCDVALLHTVGVFGGLLWGALLLHLLLAMPSGALRRAVDRYVAMAGYAAATVLNVVPVLFTENRSAICRDCPDNLARLQSRPGLADALFTVQQWWIAGVALAGSVLLAARWRRATPREQLALAPVLCVGAMAVAVVAVDLPFEALGVHAIADRIDWVLLILFAVIPFAILAGLLRSRLHRADAVADLVERLGAAPRPGRLRDALADALGDPSLELVYWLPEQGGYADADGQPVQLPQDASVRVTTEFRLDDQRVAAIVHDAALSEEPELLRNVGAAAAMALDRERLQAELRARLEELRASRARIVHASDAERRRLERDLHDGAQQRLLSVMLAIKLARRSAATDATARETMLDRVERDLQGAVEELRMLANGILPPVLVDHGLKAAVEELAHRSAIEVDVEDVPSERFPDSIEVAAYFVIAEALTNVVKYAEVDRATVHVTRHRGSVVIEIADAGVGGADAASGSGIRGLVDRVGALGGRLAVDSKPGQGTTIRAQIPIETSAHD